MIFLYIQVSVGAFLKEFGPTTPLDPPLLIKNIIYEISCKVSKMVYLYMRSYRPCNQS